MKSHVQFVSGAEPEARAAARRTRPTCTRGDAGPYAVTLTPGHLTAGRYHLDAIPRGADGTFSTPSATAFTIRR